MSLALEALASHPPTETGGANASTGFDYQRSWTLCLLLELHKTDEDYLVICDYHDDVLVLDGGRTANRIDFYQVKTTGSRPWTLQKLLNQAKAKDGSRLPSVLGKLFRHKRNFGSTARNLAIVCNHPFAIDTQPGVARDPERFTFEALGADDQRKVTETLRVQLQLSDSPTIGTALHFVLSNLNLHDHDSGARGRLEAFLRTRYPDREQFPVGPIYQTLADELSRLSSKKGIPNSADRLAHLKGIERKQFDEYIISCIEKSDRRQPHRVLTELTSELNSEGVPFRTRVKIRRALERFALERMDRTRTDLANLASEALLFLKRPSLPDRLFDILTQGITHLRKRKEARTLTDEYLMAIVAWEAISNGDWELQTADPQPPEETS